MLAQDLTHGLCKGLAHIATIAQHALCPLQPRLAALKCLQRHRNMTLDALDIFASVIVLQVRRVCVLDALRVNDQERA